MTGTDTFFDNEAAGWSARYHQDPRFARRFAKLTALLARHLPRPPFTALDAGCGTGVFSRWLALRGAEIIAIDPSAMMIAEAELQPRDAITYLQCDIDAYTSATRFDLVIALSILEYVEDAEAALDRLTELCETTLVLSVPNRGGIVRRIERAVVSLGRVTRAVVLRNRGQYLRYQHHQWDPKSLDAALAARGFRRVDHSFLGTSVAFPSLLLPAFERAWWAAMYCAVYRRS